MKAIPCPHQQAQRALMILSIPDDRGAHEDDDDVTVVVEATANVISLPRGCWPARCELRIRKIKFFETKLQGKLLHMILSSDIYFMQGGLKMCLGSVTTKRGDITAVSIPCHHRRRPALVRF